MISADFPLIFCPVTALLTSCAPPPCPPRDLLCPPVTFNTAALPSPVATKMILWAAFSTGSVRVTLCGGGFGESLMGATIFSCSWGRNASGNRSCLPLCCICGAATEPAPASPYPSTKYTVSAGLPLIILWVFEVGSYSVTQAALSLTVSFPSAGMTDICHHAQGV